MFAAPVAVLFAVASPAAMARAVPTPIPQELRSREFSVLLDGKPADVAHAAAGYDYISFDMTSPVVVTITANEDGFWDRGVDVQPWRLGIRPDRVDGKKLDGKPGRSIRFRVDSPEKLAISRPESFLNRAKMLFLFAAKPIDPAPAPAAKVHIVPPGIHRGSLNPKTGETWYLSPGAVIYGSINLWKVSGVKVLGRGVVVYDGPQNPEDDDGWMQRPDWHCIGALESHHIEIHGLTCLVRSRTWSIQMKDSTGFIYDDVRVIGGNPGNANQDGMDWLGGGVTVVRDSFFRASDDVFALQGNWDGYSEADMQRPGHDVGNILVEHSVLSTSISNIVRTGWPEKTFNTYNFTLRDSDILHGGIGSCGLPFALFTYWGAKGAGGSHTGYHFENLWLDDWYSLVQMEQENAGLYDFTFRNVWALDQPPLVPSRLVGDVRKVQFENVKFGQKVATRNADLPLNVTDGAEQPRITGADPAVRAAFTVSPAVITPGEEAEFTAFTSSDGSDRASRYTWLFGDGTTATGPHVKHRFPDAEGTALDAQNGAGRFRVLLHVEDKSGNQDWASQGVVVVGRWQSGSGKISTVPGLNYQIYPGTWPEMPPLSNQAAAVHGVAATMSAASAGGYKKFAVVYDGLVEAPQDGGYSFHLMSRDGARLMIDGVEVTATGVPFAEVCGSSVNAVRYATGAIGLRAGRHTLRLEALESMSPSAPRLLWDGPGIQLADVPATALSHLNLPVVEPRPVPAAAAEVAGPDGLDRDTAETEQAEPVLNAQAGFFLADPSQPGIPPSMPRR